MTEIRSKVVTRWLTLTLILAALPCAQSRSSENGPALWQISDHDTTVYLFGTMHATRVGQTWLTEEVESALAASEEIYLEVRKDTPRAETRRILQEHAFNPEGVALNSLLSQPEAAKLYEVALDRGVSWKTLQRTKPWYAAIILENAKLVQRGVDTAAAVESYLVNRSDQSGKRLRYFDSFEQQLRYFSDLPNDVQVRFLMTILQDDFENPEMFDELYTAWASGDTQALSAFTTIGANAMTMPPVYDALVKGRNLSWAETLDVLIQQQPGTFFVAVGILHLVGADRVQRTLSERGYLVERVN